MINFYEYLLKLEADAPPPPPPSGDAMGGSSPPPPPPPGGDAMGGLGGMGDPSGGAAGGQQPRKAVNVTTWMDALKMVLGKNHQQNKRHPTMNQQNNSTSKPKSLMQ